MWSSEFTIDEYLTELIEEPITRLVSDEVSREAQRLANNVKEVLSKGRDSIRKVLERNEYLKKITPSNKSLKYVALDTGFTSPPIELIGGRLLIIVRSHILVGTSSKYLAPTDSVGIIRFVQDENLGKPLSKIIERKFVKEVLELKERGELDIDLIVIDGELFPRAPPGYLSEKSTSGMSKLYKKIIRLTQEIVELADKTDTALVGVVKRAYGRDLQVLLKIPPKELKYFQINDKAIATYILNPGEWIDIGSYADIVYYLHEYLRIVRDEIRACEERNCNDISLLRSIERSLNSRYAWIVGVVKCGDHDLWPIRVALYKAKSPKYFMSATKVELWPSSVLSIDDLISFLASITGINGVPHPIDLVDSLCRIRKELLYITQQKLYSELARILGDNELALSLAGLTNPEKMRSIGFR